MEGHEAPGKASTIGESEFARLHPFAVSNRHEVRQLLEEARTHRAVFRRGLNRSIEAEILYIDHIGNDVVVFRSSGLELCDETSLNLRFRVGGRPYFFSARVVRERNGNRVETQFPEKVYLSERRDRDRRRVSPGGAPPEVRIFLRNGMTIAADVRDESAGGLGLAIAPGVAITPRERVEVKGVGGRYSGWKTFGIIQYARAEGEENGGLRLGLKAIPSEQGGRVPVENYEDALRQSGWQRLRTGWDIMRAGAQVSARRLLPRLVTRTRPEIDVVRYENRDHEGIVGIVDSYGDTRGAPAVVIPPAWGRTKETLVALSRTIVATFAASGTPVVVLRYDGVRRRGESYNDPECREPGKEHLRFTFSQGVRDIEGSVRFLRESPRFQCTNVVLVTFSAASIEGRKAVAERCGGGVSGWVSVVGSADLQAMMRVISGGIDYVGGVEKGVEFGMQEVLGFGVDIDHAGRDALLHGLGFLEDARQDFSRITIPITWLHGRDDAWMDPDRVLDAMSHGSASERRFIEIPTGHQLRSSRRAIEVFQLIASEMSRMALGRPLQPRSPDLVRLSERARAERKRLDQSSPDLNSFWHDYLLGRRSGHGIEMMTRTAAYQRMMDAQIACLRLEENDRLLDLGSGTGPLSERLVERGHAAGLVVHEVDYVGAALKRSYEKIEGREKRTRLRTSRTRANLDLRAGVHRIPLAARSYDAVLASLLLSYVAAPMQLLRETRRVLRPGGRIVVSTLQKDADISKLFMDSYKELAQRDDVVSARTEPGALEAAAREFLNDASRLLDLEDLGCFRFWDADELAKMMQATGFYKVKVFEAFGQPPQALVAHGEKGMGG